MTALMALWRKECLSLLSGFGGESSLARLSWLALMFSGGVLLPLMIGEYWLINPAFLVVFPILGGVLVTQNVIDTVAGERERHTLETLLTTPASPAVLLWGKWLPTVLLAFVIGMGNLVLGCVTVNLTGEFEGWRWPAVQWLWGLPLLAILFPGLTVSAGFLGSLLAHTTRQATQVFTLTLAVLLLVPPVAWVLAPDRHVAPVRETWLALDGQSALMVVLAVLLLVDLMLLGMALGRLRRLRAV